MRLTQPKVWLIAEPAIDWDAVKDYLTEVDGMDWFQRILLDQVEDAEVDPSDGDILTEFAGRLCYRSWAPGLNANVTKVRDDSKKYIENILESRHGSVMEHAQYTFVFHNVSRVFTHELVRHRAGVAISQESLRFVRLVDIGFRIPPVLQPFEAEVVSIVERLEEFQVKAAEHYQLDSGYIPFEIKKEVTSALRRLAPIGLSTGMVWSANLRTIRHVLEMRTAKGVEEEMPLVFDQVAMIMRQRAPFIMQDFKRSEGGIWTPKFSKV